MLRKLLIANRGEIAVRVIRAARELGIRTVAVFSEADRHAIHPALADEAVCIGPAEPSLSYLRIDRILEAAGKVGADSIHPGYGFLSERAEFSLACREAGIAFVGPSPEAMRKLGAKIDAKKLAVDAGVPVTPGYFEPGASDERLLQEAQTIGFPVMLKASAGGGGRGMRIVREPSRFLEEASIARSEAEAGFGDGALMVERLIERPRHVEAQFLADGRGKVAVLFERECSIQRRHQKLIEEAPSPVFMAQPERWEPMRESVERLVKLADYVGAGTAEFMVDPATGDFYFLEVNARLQVEHPVTEAITGVDLVKEQLRVAAGEGIGDVVQGRSGIHGHAIEVRIVAEDPARGFMPSIGRIEAWAEPKAPGIRVDTGFGTGSEVTRHYDSLIAKVIAHARTREESILRLRAALLDFHVLGVQTNIAYLLDVLDHPEFKEGRIDTGFLGRAFADWQPRADVPREVVAIAGAAGSAATSMPERKRGGAWSATDDYRNVG